MAPFNLSNDCWLQKDSTAAFLVLLYIQEAGEFFNKNCQSDIPHLHA
jgi:hypothetical protein